MNWIDQISTSGRPFFTTLPTSKNLGTTAQGVLELSFPQGIPGFPTINRYLLQPFGADNHLCTLTSKQTIDVRFFVLPYICGRVSINDADITTAITATNIRLEDLAIFLMLSIHKQPSSNNIILYVNLRAPIFVDMREKIAAQYVIPNSSYVVRHRIYSIW